jgi:hypothetical protein
MSNLTGVGIFICPTCNTFVDLPNWM